jgi:hypothetical protein
VAGIMRALQSDAETVLMMDAILAMKLTLGACDVQERAMARIPGRSREARADEIVDLPGGGKRMRIRTMDGLKAFMRSQQ